MSDPIREILLDTRVVQHALRRGEVSHEQVRKTLDELPDDAAEAVEADARFTTPFSDRVDDR